MPVKASMSQLANILENFLDDNERNLPPNMYDELVEIYEELDAEAYDLENQLRISEEENLRLQDEVEDLRYALESLEEELDNE